MDGTELKKVLAGLSIVGLLTVSSLGVTGCASSGKSSCTGDTKGAEKSEMSKEGNSSSCTGDTEKERKSEGNSSCTGSSSCTGE